jgi:pentatricopeptide repeat protein
MVLAKSSLRGRTHRAMSSSTFVPVPSRTLATPRRARRAMCPLLPSVAVTCILPGSSQRAENIDDGNKTGARRGPGSSSVSSSGGGGNLSGNGRQRPPRRAMRGAKAGTRFSPYADFESAPPNAGAGGSDDWFISKEEKGTIAASAGPRGESGIRSSGGKGRNRDDRQRNQQHEHQQQDQRHHQNGSKSQQQRQDALKDHREAQQGSMQQQKQRKNDDDSKHYSAKSGGPPRKRNPVLAKLLYGTDLQVRSALEELATGNTPMNIHEFNDVLSTLGRQRKMRAAVGLIRVSESSAFAKRIAPHRNVKTYTIILDIHGKARQLPRAFTLFYGMQRDGVQPNVITYNALVNSCSRNNEPELAFEVFLEMQAAGLKPDKFTYASLIDSRAKRGEVDRAFEIAGLMDRNGVVKDQTIYSALVDACGRVKQLNRALLVFEEMKRRGVWPNLITFAVLLDCCANTRNPYKAFEIFAEIKYWDLEPNVVTYTSLLDCCSKAGWPERAEMVLQHMRDNNVEPNEITYGALIDAWCRDGRLDRAFAAVDMMASKDGVAPNAVLVGGLVEACRRLKDGTRIADIWALVQANNIRPARGYYPSLIALSAHSKDFDTSMAIAAYCYPRGMLRRASVNSSDPVMRALAYAMICLRGGICEIRDSEERASRLARLVPILDAMQLPELMSASQAFRETSSAWEASHSTDLPHKNGGIERLSDGPSPAARQAKDIAMLQLNAL